MMFGRQAYGALHTGYHSQVLSFYLCPLPDRHDADGYYRFRYRCL